MGEKKHRSSRALRPAMRSPGRLPGWHREHQERFWKEIAAGESSEKAAALSGLSFGVGNRCPSTISRELRRNAATRSGQMAYRAINAQWHAALRGRRPKVAKLTANQALHAYVQERLAGAITTPDRAPRGPKVRSWNGRRHGRRQDRRWANSWSPEPIANRLPVGFADDTSMRISHEAIYQALYVQGRGALKRELVACLRTGRALRVPRARVRAVRTS